MEGNLIAAHQEIQKLGLLLSCRALLTEAQIRESAILKVARYDVFQLTESMLAGDLARLNRMLDGLKGRGRAFALNSVERDRRASDTIEATGGKSAW